jgi:methylglutaconyl-CoA hydratase
MTYQTLRLDRAGPVATVTLARPEQHNAFNATTVAELAAAFTALGADPAVRVVVLAGDGPSFSAGADLAWMKAVAGYGFEENVADALRLADCLAAIRDCPRPVVCRVQGAALGGGAGLVAAADIAVAAAGTRFAFSEVRLGLVPAVISPFVLERIGPAAARELFLTGERFDAARALAIGLVQHVVPEADLDAAVQDRIEALLAAAPGAQAVAKGLIAHVAGRPPTVRADTARLIAERRASAEGQEGMAAFLARRSPAWAATPGSPATVAPSRAVAAPASATAEQGQ